MNLATFTASPRADAIRHRAVSYAAAALDRPRTVLGVEAADWNEQRRRELATARRLLTAAARHGTDRDLRAFTARVEAELGRVADAERARIRRAIARLDQQRDRLQAELAALDQT